MKERTYIMRFEEPTMEIVELNQEDIITTNSGLNNGGKGVVDDPLNQTGIVGQQ